MNVRLFTSYYAESNRVRLREILNCLQRNLDCNLFGEVCLFLEGECEIPLESAKLTVRRTAQRPQYADYFQWANQIASDRDITVVANSDICFNQTLVPLFRLLSSDCCAALSRWDLLIDGTERLFDRADSQDAWVFRGKIESTVSDFCVGIPRCDNRILYELRAAGYQVINPAFSVKALHLHQGARSEYPGDIQGPSVSPPYAYLFPHNLFTLPETLYWNICNPRQRIEWRIDPRRTKSLPRRFLRWAKNILTSAPHRSE